MTKKLTLKIEDLEDRIAPGLMLPNGDVVFGGLMLPHGNAPHPAGPLGLGTNGFPGPWHATAPFGGPLPFG